MPLRLYPKTSLRSSNLLPNCLLPCSQQKTSTLLHRESEHVRPTCSQASFQLFPSPVSPDSTPSNFSWVPQFPDTSQASSLSKPGLCLGVWSTSPTKALLNQILALPVSYLSYRPYTRPILATIDNTDLLSLALPLPESFLHFSKQFRFLFSFPASFHISRQYGILKLQKLYVHCRNFRWQQTKTWEHKNSEASCLRE